MKENKVNLLTANHIFEKLLRMFFKWKENYIRSRFRTLGIKEEQQNSKILEKYNKFFPLHVFNIYYHLKIITLYDGVSQHF